MSLPSDLAVTAEVVLPADVTLLRPDGRPALAAVVAIGRLIEAQATERRQDAAPVGRAAVVARPTTPLPFVPVGFIAIRVSDEYLKRGSSYTCPARQLEGGPLSEPPPGMAADFSNVGRLCVGIEFCSTLHVRLRDRRAIKLLREEGLVAGGIVAVTQLDRLSRAADEAMTIVDEAAAAGARVYARGIGSQKSEWVDATERRAEAKASLQCA